MNEPKMRKKLQLNKDTVKTLTSADTAIVGGGLFVNNCPSDGISCVDCGSLSCYCDTQECSGVSVCLCTVTTVC